MKLFPPTRDGKRSFRKNPWEFRGFFKSCGIRKVCHGSSKLFYHWCWFNCGGKREIKPRRMSQDNHGQPISKRLTKQRNK